MARQIAALIAGLALASCADEEARDQASAAEERANSAYALAEETAIAAERRADEMEQRLMLVEGEYNAAY